ncbi:MAG: bleomycin resistance protein [Marmoricola sp.]|nr:bleomycin resistance protein [Marmoricola sp.]
MSAPRLQNAHVGMADDSTGSRPKVPSGARLRCGMTDRATPNLPARDFARTSGFYAELGFTEDYRDDGWMIL